MCFMQKPPELNPLPPTPTAQDQDEAAKIIGPFWDEWAKSKGPDAAAAVKQVRAALGR